jgi:hypothetical protein
LSDEAPRRRPRRDARWPNITILTTPAVYDDWGNPVECYNYGYPFYGGPFFGFGGPFFFNGHRHFHFFVNHGFINRGFVGRPFMGHGFVGQPGFAGHPGFVGQPFMATASLADSMA